MSIEPPEESALQAPGFEASGTEPAEWDEDWSEWLECGAALEEMLLWDCSWDENPLDDSYAAGEDYSSTDSADPVFSIAVSGYGNNR